MKCRDLSLESNLPAAGSTSAATAKPYPEDLSFREENVLLYENKDVQKIFSHPKVVSMCYTPEVKNGEKAGRKVLLVGIEDAYDEMKDEIPTTVKFNEKEIPIDVVEEGELKLCCFDGGAQLKVTYKCSGHEMEGTLGACVKEGEKYYLYSCAHVLSGFKEENRGSKIEVKSENELTYEDLGWTVSRPFIICQDEPDRVYVDLAMAEVNENELSNRVTGIGERYTQRPTKSYHPRGNKWKSGIWHYI